MGQVFQREGPKRQSTFSLLHYIYANHACFDSKPSCLMFRYLFVFFLIAVVIGKRLRSPEKDAVVAQVFRDGFFKEYAYSRRICRLKIFSGKYPAGDCCSIISF